MRLTLLLAVLVWLVPIAAHAEARVVLAVLAGDDAVARATTARAASELEQRGFEVSSHAIEGGADPLASTLERARAIDAVVGVVVVVDEKGGAQIDVIDRVTGKRLQRSLPAAPDGHGRSTIALAVAELVDASLVELRLPAETAVGEIAPPPDLPIPAPTEDRVRGQAGATVGLLWPARHETPVGVVMAEVGLRPSTRVGLVAEATLPLHAIRTEVLLATIRTLPFFVGVRTDVDVLPRRSRVRLDLQGAIDAIALRIDVDARPGARASPQTAWTTAGVVGLSFHGAVGPHTHLGAVVRVVVPFDDIRVRFDGATVQRLGPVWVGGGGSVIVRW